MKLSQIKDVLQSLETVTFQLPDGASVPPHFHVTEVGKISKHFIDCGGTVRLEEAVNFQLWQADDYDHRLAPEKLFKIIEMSQEKLDIDDDLEIEVEYQSDTIGKYGLDFDGTQFLLTSKLTDCLAKDKCGIEQKPAPAIKMAQSAPCCSPKSGCC